MIELPDNAVLVRSLRCTVCPACGCSKGANNTFCRACFLALAKPLRDALYRRLGEGYEAAVHAALHALKVRECTWPPATDPKSGAIRYQGRRPPAGAARRLLERDARSEGGGA